jgi:hypothetical protein
LQVLLTPGRSLSHVDPVGSLGRIPPDARLRHGLSPTRRVLGVEAP